MILQVPCLPEQGGNRLYHPRDLFPPFRLKQTIINIYSKVFGLTDMDLRKKIVNAGLKYFGRFFIEQVKNHGRDMVRAFGGDFQPRLHPFA